MSETLIEKGVRTLQVTLAPEDYKPELEKELKKLGRSINIPGFRPGLVPHSILLKRYGTEVLKELLVKMSLKALHDSLRQENLHYIFEPVLTDTNLGDLDPAVSKTYHFEFSVALYPEFDIQWPQAGQFVTEPQPVTEEQVSEVFERHRMEAGDVVEVEKADMDDDIVVGFFHAYLTGQEQPEFESRVVFRRKDVVSEEYQKRLSELKNGDTLEVSPANIFRDPSGRFLYRQGLDDYLQRQDVRWVLRVENIRRRVPAELTEDFFKTQSGDENITTEEAFRALLRSQLEALAASDARKQAISDLREWLVREHKDRMEIPKNFVRRWMQSKAGENDTGKDWEAEFENLRDGYVWQLLRHRMCEAKNISASAEDIERELEYLISARLRGMGIFNPEPATVERLKKSFRSDEEEMTRVSNVALERKLFDHFIQSGVII